MKIVNLKIYIGSFKEFYLLGVAYAVRMKQENSCFISCTNKSTGLYFTHSVQLFKQHYSAPNAINIFLLN